MIYSLTSKKPTVTECTKMSDEPNVKLEIEQEENQPYNQVEDGPFKGVFYKITNAQVVEEDGQTMIQFDYDTKGLNEENEAEFEKFIGELLIEALTNELKKNMTDEELEKLWH